MSNNSDPRNFQVDLGGVVDLLSRHIYSGPRVYLRELLQNGVDAIAARREVDPSAPAEIRIRPLTAERDTFALTDTGVGLTASEAAELLTTVGRTSKRDEFGLQREGRLGQFGVGLLSCFMVADEVTMVSRSTTTGTAAVQWTGFADGTFELVELNEQQTDTLPVGTTTYLTPRPDERALLVEEAVVRIATEYGQYLPVQTVVEGIRHTTITMEPVFGEGVDRPTRLAAGRERLGRSPFDVIDLAGPDSPGLQGVAYVLPTPQAPHMTRQHSVYVNRMLVNHGPTALLPSWAFFVECELNSTQVSPTASRESLVDDAALAATREHIGARIRNWLMSTAQASPHRLREFTAVHDLALRALCLSDEELAGTVLQFLSFETTDGRQSASDIVDLIAESGRELQVARNLDDFRQIAALTPAQPTASTPLVINGGYVHDTELVWMFPRIFDGVSVATADLRASLDLLEVPPLSVSDQVSSLEAQITEVLADCDVQGSVRIFEPADMPAVFITDRAASASRERRDAKGKTTDQWASILDTVDLTFGASATAPPDSGPLSVLCLNWNCPLVRQVASAKDSAVVSRTLRLLYVQALLAGRRPLGPKERSMLTGSLSDLVALSIGPEL